MAEQSSTKSGSDFATNCIFLLFSLCGLFFVPHLSLQVHPSPKTQNLSISYNYPGAPPEVVEQDVTSKLESVFSGMRSIQSVQSISKLGGGAIELIFDQKSQPEKIRFEVLSRIRQVYPRLPEKLSYPQVHFQSLFESHRNLLVYALTGTASAQDLEQLAKDHILQEIAAIKGVHEIQIYGAPGKRWQLAYDFNKLQQLQLSPSEIAQAIREYHYTAELGAVETAQYVRLTGPASEQPAWDRIPVAKRNGRLLYLNELAELSLQTQPPNAYYRINGQEVINVVIKADKSVNQLRLATRLRSQMATIVSQQSGRLQLHLAYDATEFLRKELNRIALCTLAALSILLAFVLLASRSFRYTFIILTLVLSNISIAFLFYYGLGIDLHLYSLIGITVSLGIVIDNSIVMLDHLRKQQSRQVFLAIFAATLTSIGAIVLIFLLDASKREALSDFALVFVINLLISLVLSLFFAPALFRTVSLAGSSHSSRSLYLRGLVYLNRMYARYILFAGRFRGLFFLLLFLLFGTPVFLLPNRMIGNSDWDKRYNATLGSRFYVDQLKPYVNIFLGGSLRLFLDNKERFVNNKLQERMALNVDIKMPEGHTLEQMNEVVSRLEQFLLPYKGIDQIQATTASAHSGGIIIYFKKEAEDSSLPLALKRGLLAEVNKIGSADFEVLGVGRVFDNEMRGQYLNQHIQLKGYHYNTLKKYAAHLESRLLRNNRIKEVFINSRPSYYAPKSTERYFSRPAPEQLAYYQIPLQKLATAIQERSVKQPAALSVYANKQRLPVHIEAKQNPMMQQWDLIHAPIPLEANAFTRLNQLTNLKTKKGFEEIVRVNQQYQLVVEYNYIGHQRTAGELNKNTIKQLRDELPLGYIVEDPDMNFWQRDGELWKILFTIGLAIVMIFIIASILFNSIRQALMAIGIIPFAFIGLFLSTWSVDFNFDQGGYAAFLLLSGLSVNAVFFIVNDFQILKKQEPTSDQLKLYLKAFQAKVVPISLMTLSTILGLLPFLLFNEAPAFWYSLAICTIGGLLFSMIGLILWLPLFFNFNKQR